MKRKHFLEAQNILVSTRQSQTMQHKSNHSHPMKDKAWLSWELTVICAIARVMRKPTRLSRGPIPIHQNQSREVKSLLIKCMIMKSLKLENWNSGVQKYTTKNKWSIIHVYWDAQFRAVFSTVTSHHVISVHRRFFNYPHTAPQPQAINGPSLLSAASQFIPHHSHTLPPLLGLPAPAPSQHCIQAAQPTPSNLVTHHHGYQHPANIVLGMHAPSCGQMTSNSSGVTGVQGNSNGWTIWELTSAV